MPKKTEKLTFENAFNRLETILESMEKGEAPLEELIAKFEEGSKLLKTCQDKLRDAELKIEKLAVETGEVNPFENQESDK